MIVRLPSFNWIARPYFPKISESLGYVIFNFRLRTDKDGALKVTRPDFDRVKQINSNRESSQKIN